MKRGKIPAALPILRRTLPVTLGRTETTEKGDERTPIAISSEHPVERWFGREILDHSASAIDRTYLDQGMAVLCEHDTREHIGVLEDVELGADRVLRGFVRYDDGPEAERVKRQVKNGIKRFTSVGYALHDIKLEESADDGDTYRATRWTPLEVSFVAIPADPSVGANRSGEDELLYPVRLTSTEGKMRRKKARAEDEELNAGAEVEEEEERSEDEDLDEDEERSEDEELDEDEERSEDDEDEEKDEDARGRGALRRRRKARSALNRPGMARRSAVSDRNTAAGNGAVTGDTRVRILGDERARVAEITALCEEHGFNQKRSEWITSGASIADVRKEVLTGVRERMGKPTQSGKPIVDMSEKEARRYSFARAIFAHIPELAGTVDAGFEREVEQEIEKKLPSEYKRRGGVLIPTMLSRAGLDSATSTKGTELKFTQPGDFIDLLRARMVLRQIGARVLAGLTGPVSFPRQTAAASGSWVGENPGSDVADSNLLLDLVTLAIKTYQASTSFSRQLLVSAISSSVDAEQMVREDLAKVHALAMDKAGIDGLGSSNQPRGILNVTGIGSVAGGTNGLAPAYAHMVDLETEVAIDNADIGSLAYLTNAKVRGKLRKTEQFATTNGQPVWTGGIEGEVNGYRAFASTQVPSDLDKGTSTGVCSAIIFGNFEDLIFGEWGALELVVDPYRLKKQGMIEVTSFQMADVVVRHPESFAAMKDALTT